MRLAAITFALLLADCGISSPLKTVSGQSARNDHLHLQTRTFEQDSLDETMDSRKQSFEQEYLNETKDSYKQSLEQDSLAELEDLEQESLAELDDRFREYWLKTCDIIVKRRRVLYKVTGAILKAMENAWASELTNAKQEALKQNEDDDAMDLNHSMNIIKSFYEEYWNKKHQHIAKYSKWDQEAQYAAEEKWAEFSLKAFSNEEWDLLITKLAGGAMDVSIGRYSTTPDDFSVFRNEVMLSKEKIHRDSWNLNVIDVLNDTFFEILKKVEPVSDNERDILNHLYLMRAHGVVFRNSE